jgi:phosphatidate cytidylyltransferase
VRQSGVRGGAVAASELRLRWLSAAVLVPLVLWACGAGGWPYVLAFSAVAAIGVNEFHGLLRAKGVIPQRVLGLSGAALLPWVVYWGDPQLAGACFAVLLVGSLIVQLFEGRSEGALAALSGTLFGTAYVGGLLSYGVALRFAPEGGLAHAGLDPAAGAFFAVFGLTCAVGSDVGGFFSGRRFGRHKLAPRISPGKTVEGALGAVALGTVGGLICWGGFRMFGESRVGELPLVMAALAAALLAAVAILGDLVESLFKRDAALKDAGHIVPGVGGVLDRIDSALFTLPVLYYCLLRYYAA